MKTVCIYHSVDLDGWMSAAIVKHWFYKNNNKRTEVNLNVVNTLSTEDRNEWESKVNSKFTDPTIYFIGYNYGQPIPDLSEYDKVIMCDISFPKEEMNKLQSSLKTNFIWIDHHISAIYDNSDNMYIEGLRNTKFAACELTWSYFFPYIVMPEIIRLLGRYDCFGHKGTDEEQKVLEFQYGARQCISNYESAYIYLKTSLDPKLNLHDTIENAILESGKSIYKYLCTEAKQVYKNGFEITLERNDIDFSSNTGVKIHPKYKFICINKERFNPIDFGIDYHKDGYDGAVCFWYNNGKWNFSLYNDNGLVDCYIIAKQFGGGGHKGASGFVCDTKTLLEIIGENGTKV